MGLGLSSATTLLSALSLVTLLSRPAFLHLLHGDFVALWYILSKFSILTAVQEISLILVSTRFL